MMRNLMAFTFPYKLSDRIIGEQSLHKGLSSSGRLSYQPLRYGKVQGRCNLLLDKMPFLGREQPIKTVYRLDNVYSVQCREDKMPGLGSIDRKPCRFGIPYLSYQYYIRVLPQGILKGIGNIIGIASYLPLIYDRIIGAFKKILYRVLYCYKMNALCP